jgi:uncharacterized damage-inducible protein DinB
VSTHAATKPAPTEHNPYYSKYVSLVLEGDIIATLNRQIDDSLSILRGISAERADYRYAPDKWSVKEVVGHLIDTERIFAYRAFRFARNDQTPLNGYEQDDYVRNGDFSNRELSDLADEFENVRRSNVHMLKGLNEQAWLRHGSANENDITVRALAYIMAGHELHHMGILKSKYLQND